MVVRGTSTVANTSNSNPNGSQRHQHRRQHQQQQPEWLSEAPAPSPTPATATQMVVRGTSTVANTSNNNPNGSQRRDVPDRTQRHQHHCRRKQQHIKNTQEWQREGVPEVRVRQQHHNLHQHEHLGKVIMEGGGRQQHKPNKHGSSCGNDSRHSVLL
jgi:hypothetical protein